MTRIQDASDNEQQWLLKIIIKYNIIFPVKNDFPEVLIQSNGIFFFTIQPL